MTYSIAGRELKIFPTLRKSEDISENPDKVTPHLNP
jgi:hypothetical protein